MVVADFLAIIGAFHLAFVLRFDSFLQAPFPVTKGYPPFEFYLMASFVIAPVWILIFNTRGVYRSRRQVDFSSEFFQIIRIISFGMLIVMSMAFFYREFEYSRLVFILIWFLAIAFVFIGRVLVLSYEKFLYRRGKELRNILLVGTNTIAHNIALWIQQQPAIGYHVVGYVSDDEDRLEGVDVKRLGEIVKLPALVKEHRIESIIVCMDEAQASLVHFITEALVGQSVQILLQSEIVGVASARIRVHEMFGIPFLGIKDIPMTTWSRVIKRTFDIVFSFVVLVLTMPLWLFAVIATWIETGRPILYKQVRVGLDGREFVLLKFRTMRLNAEAESGPTWTRKEDDRVTRIGKILRRFSIDELPQLVNVLRGDMSIVGPRPERPEFVSQFRQYVPKYLERHRLKTGLTGWAQVNGLRGEVPIVERTKYDLYYIENWSLRLDFRIIFKTIRAVLFGKDAY